MADRTRLAVLLITHDMGVVADLADGVAVMRDGTIVERGYVDEVLCQPQEKYTRDLLAAVPRMPDRGLGGRAGRAHPFRWSSRASASEPVSSPTSLKPSSPASRT